MERTIFHFYLLPLLAGLLLGVLPLPGRSSSRFPWTAAGELIRGAIATLAGALLSPASLAPPLAIWGTAFSARWLAPRLTARQAREQKSEVPLPEGSRFHQAPEPKPDTPSLEAGDPSPAPEPQPGPPPPGEEPSASGHPLPEPEERPRTPSEHPAAAQREHPPVSQPRHAPMASDPPPILQPEHASIAPPEQPGHAMVPAEHPEHVPTAPPENPPIQPEHAPTTPPDRPPPARRTLNGSVWILLGALLVADPWLALAWLALSLVLRPLISRPELTPALAAVIFPFRLEEAAGKGGLIVGLALLALLLPGPGRDRSC